MVNGLMSMKGIPSGTVTPDRNGFMCLTVFYGEAHKAGKEDKGKHGHNNVSGDQRQPHDFSSKVVSHEEK